MFQFDENWDPEEEQRIEQEEKEKDGGNGEEMRRDANFYDDYFATDLAAKLMPTTTMAPAQNGGRQMPPPRFVEHPQSEWIVRSRPAQLSCTAENVRRIRVKCNAKWLDESRVRLEEGLDPASGQPTLRAHAEIQRAELDAWLADLGEFACQCWAFGGHQDEAEEEAEGRKKSGGDEEEEDEEEEEDDEDDDEDGMGPSTSTKSSGQPIRSETARIRLAYLRKHFHQVPISQRVHEGRTVQLQCQPPDGDPKAEVFWHKNGQQLHFPAPGSARTSASGQNMILAGDGSLILSAARLSDSGNFSCEARNPANRRFTETAELAVYVDGDWSPWSEWEGDCANVLLDCPVLLSQLAMVRGDGDAVQRVLPRQGRTRTCNNPAPLNGGRACQGPEEEFRECGHGCRLDGAWTQWGPWASQCDAQCRRERRRDCAAPAPTNGGLDCAGPTQQWRNCSGASREAPLPVPDHCLPGATVPVAPPSIVAPPTPSTSSHHATSARPLFDSQLLALASLGCVAFLLLVIALLAGLLFCARRKRGAKCADNGGGGTGAHCGAGIFLDREEKLYFPGAAVATTTEDELGNVRTVLLDQKLLDSLGPSPAHYGPPTSTTTPLLPRFFSLKPGQGAALHPTLSTPPPPAARLAAFLQSPNSYTLRSWSSRNGGGGGGVQPYASGPIRANSRTTGHKQDVAGSRVALLPEYSSSSQGSNRTGGHCSTRRCSARDEEENNYATLYEELGGGGGGGRTAASTESMVEDSSGAGGQYALSSSRASSLEEDNGTEAMGGRGRGGKEDGGGGGGPTFVAVEMDQDSARIELRRSGAALTIGEGTFHEACTLFLSVSDDSADRPALDEGETWLSASVAFGACDQRPLRLRRPVVLSVDHCASLFPKPHCWLVSVWAQLDQSGQWTKAWEEEGGGGQKDGEGKDEGEEEEQFGLHMDRERWHLLTRRPGRFLLVGRQRRAHVAAQKRVHLCAYWTPPNNAAASNAAGRLGGPPPPPRPDHRPCYDPVPLGGGAVELAQIRVYCVPETAMAMESVRQQERRRMGGMLLAECENFLLQARGPLCCCLEKISFIGGEAHPTGGSQYLECPDHVHRWCSQNGLHFQLNVPGIPSSPACPTLPRSLRGRLVLYQKGNTTERQVLSFSQDADQPNQQPIGREDSELSQLSAFDSGPLELVSFSRFQLSAQARSQLANLLLEDCGADESGAGDWRALSEKLGFQRHIPFLLCQPSPALSLLELWEAVHAGSDRALLDLLQTLRVLGRPDAVQLLELFLTDQQAAQCPPAPFCSLSASPEESRQELATSARLHRAISE